MKFMDAFWKSTTYKDAGIRSFFKFVKQKIPKISPTELIALRSGNTSIDRQILQGKVILPSKPKYENKFPEILMTDLFKNFKRAPFPESRNNPAGDRKMMDQPFYSLFHTYIILRN